MVKARGGWSEMQGRVRCDCKDGRLNESCGFKVGPECDAVFSFSASR